MVRTVVAGLLAVGMLILMPAKNMAEVPDFVNYSGRLTDGTAWGQSTTLSMTFRLYDQKEGGSPLWEQPFPDLEKNPEAQPVAVQDGYFSVVLGEGAGPNGQPLNVTNVFADHDQTWISVCLGEDCLPEEDMLPRQQIGSVPYAVRAENAIHTEIRYGDSRYSLGAVFRTTTEGKVVNNGSFDGTGKTKGRIEIEGVAVGYRSAKVACELAVGSPSAHACAPQEMAVSMSLGTGTPGYTWLSSGIWAVASLADSGWYSNDCDGFTGGTNEGPLGKRTGMTWAGHRALHDSCASPKPIACCDFPAN